MQCRQIVSRQWMHWSLELLSKYKDDWNKQQLLSSMNIEQLVDGIRNFWILNFKSNRSMPQTYWRIFFSHYSFFFQYDGLKIYTLTGFIEVIHARFILHHAPSTIPKIMPFDGNISIAWQWMRYQSKQVICLSHRVICPMSHLFQFQPNWIMHRWENFMYFFFGRIRKSDPLALSPSCYLVYSFYQSPREDG